MGQNKDSNQEDIATRVRNSRQKRREAALIELRVWVCEEDRRNVQNAVRPYYDKAKQRLKDQ